MPEGNDFRLDGKGNGQGERGKGKGERGHGDIADDFLAFLLEQ